MKFKPLSIAFAVASATVFASNASAQTSTQLRSCRDYVADQFNQFSAASIEVAPGEQRSNGLATVYWQLRDRRASGLCLVDRRNEVIDFRQSNDTRYGNDRYGDDRYGDDRYGRDRDDRDRYGRDRNDRDRNDRDRYGRDRDDRDRYGRDRHDNGLVEYNWGSRIRPFAAQISERGTTLVNRPNKGNKRDVANVDRGDNVIVQRTYMERESGITWLLVRDTRGREGWVNARRISRR